MPIVAGDRRTLCTCGKTAGSVACNVADSVATVFAGGAVMLPLKPPVTGANEIDAGPCGDAAIDPLAAGGNVGVGDGITTDGGIADEPPPPPHPTALAAKAISAADNFAVRHEPMSCGSGVNTARLVSNIAHNARACISHSLTRSSAFF
ncbi:MAG TPA: hypothetical protein VGU66_01680 [Candidatus Elarobacter sp.]|nr:hypothetical protein [Candidatus Elarobacter sp.]